MPNNKNNVSYGKPKIGGSIYAAKIGTVLPTDAKTTLNEGFKQLGYVSEDGVSNGRSIETEKVKAWGGDNVITTQTGNDDTFKFKLIESLNVDVLKTIYGEENVEGELETGITVKVNSKETGAASWIIDMVLKGGVAKRIVIPSAAITSMEEIVYKDNSAIGYGITLTADPDKDGNTHMEYIVKGEQK